MVFLELRREPGECSRVTAWMPYKICVSSVSSGLLSQCEGHLRILLEVWQGNRDVSRCEAVDPVSLSSCHRELGFLSIFQRRQPSSPFEALNSVCLSSCQRDVRPPVEMRRETRAFSRVSTGDSDIPSSCDMKDEPAFKSQQGNPAFFRVRASRCPSHLRRQNQLLLTYL